MNTISSINTLSKTTKEDLSLIITYLRYSFDTLSHILLYDTENSCKLLVIVNELYREERTKFEAVSRTIEEFAQNSYIFTRPHITIVGDETFFLCMKIEQNMIYDAAMAGEVIFDAEVERDLLWS